MPASEVGAYQFIAFTVCQAEARLYASIGAGQAAREKKSAEILSALFPYSFYCISCATMSVYAPGSSSGSPAMRFACS